MGIKSVYIGTSSSYGSLVYYLPTWDCDWYWGFGYIGNRHNHLHLKNLPDTHGNLKDRVDSFFDDDFVLKEDHKKWQFAELVKTAYSLKECAEVLGRGGSHYTSNPLSEVIKNPEEVKRINEEVLPKIFFRIQTLLSPQSGV